MRRKLLVAGAAVAILGGAVAGVLLTRSSGGNDGPANPELPPATAKVIRTNLVETKTVSGTLGYGDPIPMRAAETGTITRIAPVGSTVRRGEALFSVDERPVVLLYGSLPLYRPLREGTKGADVKELERNLAALGFIGFTVDDTYGAATATAVRTWQAKLGSPPTGTVEPGQMVFTRGAVRIAEHGARVGDTVGRGSAEGGGSVLSYTSPAKRVSVQLEVVDASLAVKGRTVTVTVPGRRPVKGSIARVGGVAATQATPPDGGATSDQGDSSGDANPAASDASIEVTVKVPDQRALGLLQAAPVDVDFVSAERNNVLAVPVAALLALPAGGFGVQVVAGDRTRIVPVKTGLFAAGRVEVSGRGIAEGVTVGIPK
jgi:membrane fusion protein, multidrug efflux system